MFPGGEAAVWRERSVAGLGERSESPVAGPGDAAHTDQAGKGWTAARRYWRHDLPAPRTGDKPGPAPDSTGARAVPAQAASADVR